MADIDSLKEEYRSNLTQCIQRVKTELDNKASADDLTKLQTQVDIIKTNDKTITGSINEINGNLLDTVDFSADYKNIILNRKNGLNPYTIPISAIIHNAKLTELNDIDSTDIGNGKTLVYDSSTQKHKYVDSELTDELVKMEASSDSEYLADLIDKNTIVNDKGVLKVKKLDGQEVTIAEINYLKGLTMNIVDLVKSFSNGGVKMYEHIIATYADLLALDRSEFVDGIRYFVYVLADETHGGIKTTYICDKTNTSYFGVAGDDRDFTTEPIDLANEVTGKLGVSNIDVDALWKLVTVYDTYKTLTTKNEPFGTHGANTMYNELVAEIGKKSNTTDLTKHTDDTNIHIITAERTKWNEVDKKVNKTDIVDNLTSTDTDKPLSANQGKILDDKKIDKTDITTTIGAMSTDTQVPSAKAMYDVLKITLIGSKQLNAYGKEIVKYPLGRWGTMGMGVKNLTDLPNDDVKYVEILGISDSATPWTVGLSTRTYRATTEDGAIFTRSITSGDKGGVIEKDTGWQKVCYTSIVEDVQLTTISKFDNETNYAVGQQAYNNYNVANGDCEITLCVRVINPDSQYGTVVKTGLPKPLSAKYFALNNWSGTDAIIAQITTSGILFLKNGTANGLYMGSFKYKVAKS